jgi:hypothetical protein
LTIFIFLVKKVLIDSLSWPVWRAKCSNGASIKQFPVDFDGKRSCMVASVGGNGSSGPARACRCGE